MNREEKKLLYLKICDFTYECKWMRWQRLMITESADDFVY